MGVYKSAEIEGGWKYSKLKWKKNFNVGYSPERTNPGDSKHTLTKIVKVVAADTPKTLEKISKLYKRKNRKRN